MTIQKADGPIITTGLESAIGSTSPVNNAPGAIAYVSATNENPDAGPNCFFAGNLFKDMRYRYLGGGGSLAVGGYASQAVGFVDHSIQTIDLVPSQIATANIAALAAPASGVAMTLVAATGLGITVTTAAVTVLPTGKVVPTAMRRIDADPAWQGYGSSSAMKGWTGAACGRAVSLTSVSNLSAITFTIRGYDVYGNPLTHAMIGPNNGTVTSTKCFKWVASVTPGGSNAGTVSVGTGDVFEFPLMARRFSKLDIWWDETRITANTGFVAAVTTDPATTTTGATRGTYATQTASDGTRRLVVVQRLAAADMATATTVFGITPV